MLLEANKSPHKACCVQQKSSLSSLQVNPYLKLSGSNLLVPCMDLFMFFKNEDVTQSAMVASVYDSHKSSKYQALK